MKTLFKFVLFAFVFMVLLVAAGLFTLTRPGVQKYLLERQLPVGGSIGQVQITPSRIALSELKLPLADGSTFRVATLRTEFSPLAAIFDRTVRLGALEVEGLVLDLAQPLIQIERSEPTGTSPGPGQASAPVGGSGEGARPAASGPVAAEADPRSLPDLLYALGQLDWLFDIQTVALSGQVRDGAGSVFALNFRSDAIRPGERSTIEASLQLNSAEQLPAGLQQFDFSTRLQLAQRLRGGFEEVTIESVATASDRAGQPLLSATKRIELMVRSFEETAELRIELNADVPRPELFLAELGVLPDLGVQGSFQATVRGEVVTLQQADFLATSQGRTFAQMRLKQAFPIGASAQPSGELMDVTLVDLPWVWVAPFLPDGLSVAGQPLRMALSLSGDADGSLRVVTREPLVVGPVSVAQQGQPLLEQVTFSAAPILRIAEDASITWQLGDFRLADRYGDLIRGTSSGQMRSGVPVMEGLQTKTELELGLLELSQQPLLAQRLSLLTGRARLLLEVEPGANYPYQLQGSLTGLSPRDTPALRQDYRFAFQARTPQADLLAFGLNLEAGSRERPSSRAQLSGQVQLGKEPLAFQLDVSGQQLTQRDLTLLAAAFSPRSEVPAASPPVVVDRGVRAAPGVRAPVAAAGDGGPVPPPWAGVDGRFGLSLDTVLLDSGHRLEAVQLKGTVNGALLNVAELSAKLGEGRLGGVGSVRFDPAAAKAYTIASQVGFSGVDPVIFAKGPATAFPVRGQFDGQLKVNARGRSLEAALDAAEGDLRITGRDGLLTAFELDNRSQLGLVGAGLLGQSLNRPGLSAMAQAVPYFQNMRFNNFVLELSRGADRNVLIPKIEFKGDHVSIDGSGFIAATSLREVLNQPLDLTLGLGAKGPLVGYLNTLQLLGTERTEDGYQRWARSIKIGGTLGAPDTSMLERLLSEAARRAVSRPVAPADAANAAPRDQTGASGQESTPAVPAQPPQRTKEERIIEDIGTGLDLLNSIMGR